MRKAFHGYILIAPVMIGCLVFTLVPFGIVLRYSFTQGYGAAGMFVGMEHYTKMFQNDLFPSGVFQHDEVFNHRAAAHHAALLSFGAPHAKAGR